MNTLVLNKDASSSSCFSKISRMVYGMKIDFIFRFLKNEYISIE
ncbi:hypothetical protein RV07_GL003095 [Enterococcus malodoratus]|nr:hypothetical protein RV07_GL003095 [Enterococcus malodoratus]